MKVFASILMLFLTGMLPIASAVASVDQPTDFHVGASYVTFWGTGMDIDWSSGAVYYPILGNYSSNNKTVANQHIEWALESGIDFFFLDYGWGTTTERLLMENAAINGLLKAESMKDFDFCICYFPYNVTYKVAEPNVYAINENALAEDFSHLNKTYFTHSSYLKLDNKSVVILVDFPSYFADQNQSVATTFIEKMNNLFLNLTGTYELFLIFASWPHVQHEYVALIFDDSTRAYDAVTLWGNNTLVDFNKTISYSEYVNKTKANFEKWNVTASEFNVSFVPLICPGYNNIIYAYMNRTQNNWWGIVARNPVGFREACLLARNYSSSPHNIVLLYTWNDFKEATSIEPTTDYGFVYLTISEIIPEFPSSLILPLFMIATLLAVTVYRRKQTVE